jgi:hypothetical protein
MQQLGVVEQLAVLVPNAKIFNRKASREGASLRSWLWSKVSVPSVNSWEVNCIVFGVEALRHY